MPQPQSQPICMDARMLGAPEGVGVAHYAEALRRAHETLSSQPLLLSDRKLLDQPPRARFGKLGRWLRARWPFKRRAKRIDDMLVVSDLFRLAQVYFDRRGKLLPVKVKGEPGIMHWSYPVPIRLVGWANVYTVHDAIPLIRPDLTTIDARRHRWLLARINDAAAAIVTVSEAARSDLSETLGCRPSHVIDCGQAVTAEPASRDDLPPELEPGRYLLVCGTVERRKNIAGILAAYRASGVTMPLVVAGADGLGADVIAPALTAIPGVIRLPYLPEAAKRAAIAHARALLMPSLIEGFGLPVIEAMALGVPVVTTHDGALAETAGGAALLVDPNSVEAMAEAFRRVAEDDALCAELIEAGRRNAERFTAERFAEKLHALYDRLIAPGT